MLNRRYAAICYKRKVKKAGLLFFTETGLSIILYGQNFVMDEPKLSNEYIIEKAKWYIDNQGKADMMWLLGELKEPLDPNRADNIACQMEQTDVYVTYNTFYDQKNFFVKRNPNFGLNENIKATNNRLKWTNIFALIIAGVTTIFIVLQYAKDDALKLQPLYKQLEKTSQILDSMQQAQKGIQTSLEKAVKDFFYASPHR